MITKIDMDQVWEINKEHFPVTLKEEGVEKINAIYEEVRDFILGLTVQPDSVSLTMTKEYTLWVNMMWGSIAHNWSIDGNTKESSLEILYGKEAETEDMEEEKGTMEDIKNLILHLNKLVYEYKMTEVNI